MFFVLFFLAFTLCAYLVLHICLGYISNNWPTTCGKISSLELRRIKRYSKFPSITGTDEILIPKVKYVYEVKGKSYTSSRYRFGISKKYKNEDELSCFEMAKEPGDTVSVYYFPAFPVISVLRPGITDLSDNVYSILFIMSVPVVLYLFKLIVNMIMH